MEVKEWILDSGHYFSHQFTIEEDTEDGSHAPFTSYFLGENYGHGDVSGS